MEKMYVITSVRTDGNHYLIGEITKNNGNYTFEYKISGEFSAWYLKIKDFPEADKIYKGLEVEKFIRSFLPMDNIPSTKYFIKSAGLNHYDVWKMFKHYGSKSNFNVLAVEELPENTVRVAV